MGTQSPAKALQQVAGRPTHVSTGVRTADRLLGGGFGVGKLTWFSFEVGCDPWGVLLRSTLKCIRRKSESAVAIASEQLGEAELQTRLCAVESKLNFDRIHAGLSSAEDRLRLVVSRKHIPWQNLSICAGRRIDPRELDELLFTYRPTLLLADVRPRAPDARRPDRLDSFDEGVKRLASLARRHQAAVVLLEAVHASQEPSSNGRRGRMTKTADVVLSMMKTRGRETFSTAKKD